MIGERGERYLTAIHPPLTIPARKLTTARTDPKSHLTNKSS